MSRKAWTLLILSSLRIRRRIPTRHMAADFGNNYGLDTFKSSVGYFSGSDHVGWFEIIFHHTTLVRIILHSSQVWATFQARIMSGGLK